MTTLSKSPDLRGLALLPAALALLIPTARAAGAQSLASPLQFTGVNLSGGEFAKPKPGVALIYGKNYIYPAAKEIDYFAGKGVNIFRIPFRWEALQPTARAPLDTADLARLKKSVSYATGRGLTVILDPHDFARYYGKVIGGSDVTNDDFADFWGKLAAEFKDSPLVWFGLMNEPNKMPTEQWLGAANAAIAAIRKTGAKNRILVPGNSWSGAHSWLKAGNTRLLEVQDPADNYIFEAHQYLDSDSSGTHRDVVSTTVGSERLRAFVDWCRTNHKKAFLGEFAVAAGSDQQAALQDMLASMEKDRDVWLGFTWWSAGAWWGDYMFSLSPTKTGEDRPQMSYLAPHLQAHPVEQTAR